MQYVNQHRRRIRTPMLIKVLHHTIMCINHNYGAVFTQSYQSICYVCIQFDNRFCYLELLHVCEFNDQPIFISSIVLSALDTGLKKVRSMLINRLNMCTVLNNVHLSPQYLCLIKSLPSTSVSFSVCFFSSSFNLLTSRLCLSNQFPTFNFYLNYD